MEKIECCNIWKRKCFIYLRNEEKICPNCHGQGASFRSAHFKQKFYTIKICALCSGTGVVDWITFATKSLSGRLKWIHHTKKISIKCRQKRGCNKLRRLFIEQNRSEEC